MIFWSGFLLFKHLILDVVTFTEFTQYIIEIEHHAANEWMNEIFLLNYVSILF